MDPSKPQKQFKTVRCILFLDKIKCDSLVTLLTDDYETLGKSAQTVAGGLIGCATSLLIWDKIWWNILLSMVTIFYSHQLSDVCSRFTYSRYKVTTVEWEKKLQYWCHSYTTPLPVTSRIRHPARFNFRKKRKMYNPNSLRGKESKGEIRVLQAVY